MADGGGYDLSQSNAASTGVTSTIGLGAINFGQQNVGLSWQIVVALVAGVAIVAWLIWGRKRA